jgi:hypothetical protein
MGSPIQRRAAKPRIKKEVVMRVWPSGILMVLLTGAFAETYAQQPSPGLLQQALARAEDPAPAGLGEWQTRIDHVRSRQHKARVLQWSGVGVGLATAVVTSILTARSASCSSSSIASGSGAVSLSRCRPGNTVVALGVGGAMSAALTAVGCGQRRSAHRDLRNLYWEGENRGYISMGVTPGRGVQAAYLLRF